VSISLDTNVLLSLWNRESTAERLANEIDAQRGKHRLVICGPVYGELYGRNLNLDALLAALDVDIEPDLTLAGWQRAGQAHAAHAERRRTSGRGTPRRTLTDFLIGAHASTNSHALLTLNIADYSDFPEVLFLTIKP
jgi:predicted nucleic acid-binding protein